MAKPNTISQYVNVVVSVPVTILVLVEYLQNLVKGGFSGSAFSILRNGPCLRCPPELRLFAISALGNQCFDLF